MRFYACGKANRYYTGSTAHGHLYRRRRRFWGRETSEVVSVGSNGKTMEGKVTAILTRPSYFQRMKDKQEKEGFFKSAIKQDTRLFDFGRKG